MRVEGREQMRADGIPGACRRADWVLDLGPGGGVNGAKIVAKGDAGDCVGQRTELHRAISARNGGKSPVRSEAVAPVNSRKRAKRASQYQPDRIAAK